MALVRKRERARLDNPPEVILTLWGVTSSHGVVSLATVLRFSVYHFSRMQRQLENYRLTIQNMKQTPMTDAVRATAIKSTDAMLNDCSAWGLESVVDQCNRIGRYLRETEKAMPLELSKMFEELQNRSEDELNRQACFVLRPDKARLYDEVKPFGEDVSVRFSNAILHIEEAVKCYATGRNTACVFHLMRVMEVGLRGLGKSLNNPNLDPKRNPTWEAILKPCDDELKKPLKDRTDEWRSDELFFSNATANLRAVKDAWRNPTLHVEINYDEERALEIFNAVKAFMRHLATKVTE